MSTAHVSARLEQGPTDNGTNMTQTLTTYDRYADHFEKLKSQIGTSEPGWLTELRLQAFERFQHFRFPVERKGNEAWKYTDVRPLERETYDYAFEPGEVRESWLNERIPFDAEMARIVFVDGHLAPELSSATRAEGLLVTTLALALNTHEAMIRKHLAEYAEVNHDAFVPLNTALHADAGFVLVTEAVTTPVHIVHVTTGRKVATFPKALVIAAPLSQLTLVETYLSAGDDNHFADPVMEIVLEDGAQVDHYRLLLENQASYHIAHVRVSQRRDSNYRCMVYETGGGLVRLDLETSFDDTGSYADLRGLYITSGEQHTDNMVSIDHAKPHNTSRLYYKGILDDKSSAVFGGTVFVRPGADKTDAHQEDKNLLLSHEAEVSSKPALEIYADDVKAGHGATAGAIADEALFYMRSRGIDEFTAMQLLVRGFASEIIDTVSIPPLREWMEGHALEALPRFRETLA
jgi:Fe-S cluster assembly protein SufD